MKSEGECLSENEEHARFLRRRLEEGNVFAAASPPPASPGTRGAHEAQPSSGGIKHDAGKPRFDLIPPDALRQVAEVFAYGPAKGIYEDRNWEKGLDWGRVFAATQRHLWAFWNGEDVDESGHLHLAHAATDILMLLALASRQVGTDDRYWPEEDNHVQGA